MPGRVVSHGTREVRVVGKAVGWNWLQVCVFPFHNQVCRLVLAPVGIPTSTTPPSAFAYTMLVPNTIAGGAGLGDNCVQLRLAAFHTQVSWSAVLLPST